MARITEALQSLQECVDEALCKTCPTIILAGAQPLHIGGSDMSWVRLVNSYPSKRFPSQDAEATSCSSPLAYVLEVGIVRCIPMQNRAPLPTASDMTKTALRLSEDMTSVRRAIGCCLDDEEWDILLGNWVPIGPQGAVVGGVWQVTITRAYGDD